MREQIRMRFDAQMSDKNAEEAELMLYGEITSGDWKFSENDKNAIDFDKAIKQFKNSGAKKLNMRINSPGGSVHEAAAMRAIICNADFKKVNIRIEGMCASAATMIASIPGAHVEIAKGSEYMIHNPWTVAIGNADEMQHEVDHLRQMEGTIRSMYAQRTGQDEEQIKAWMDEETWFTAEDAVKHGFCDAVTAEAHEGATMMVARPMMCAMRDMYRNIPTDVQEEPEEPEDNEDSNADPHAGEATINNSKEETQMEIKDLTIEQLKAENAELLNSIRDEAINAERQRVADIEALTLSGYEEMAETAKMEGTSALEFQKQIVAAQREKGKKFLANRTQETEPAKAIAGQEPADTQTDEDDAEEKAYLKMAAEYGSATNGGMY